MGLYRKKPVVIEATQFFASDYPDRSPDGINASWEAATVDASDAHIDGFWISTLEGPLRVSNGDWIITGVQGERYPCKPDIFAATYEPASATDDLGSSPSPDPSPRSAGGS